MADSLRPSGIDILGAVPWGTHFCQFYRTHQDLVDVLVPYFRAGLEANEFCMWITSVPLGPAEARAALAAAVPALDERVRNGQIEILAHDQWYTRDGVFDDDCVLRGWVAKLQAALARGYDGLRLSGNTFWLERDGWAAFTEYEARVNDVIGHYPMMALCTYCLDRCDGAAVLDVVKNHEFALIRQEGRWDLIESAVYKKAKEELRRRTMALEQANQELEAFSYSVSHDLRAPLRAIDGFSRVLADEYEGRLDDNGRHYLTTIRRNAIDMGRLIDDILDFSRTAQRQMAPAPVDMAALVREVFEEVRSAAPARTIVLRVGELPPAMGDRAMIRQAVLNLLSNAVKFTSPRDEAVIDVDAFADGREQIYRVRDNGVGFDLQDADRLFGVFERLHAPEQFEGTGIGLAIVKRIVVRHGGRVWADARPGEGATFYFTLPSPTRPLEGMGD